MGAPSKPSAPPPPPPPPRPPEPKAEDRDPKDIEKSVRGRRTSARRATSLLGGVTTGKTLLGE